MIRKNASRLLVVVAGLAVLVAVAAVAYYAGNTAAGTPDRGFVSPRFHGMGGMSFSQAGGLGGFWLIGALLLGFLLVLVIMALAGSGGPSTRPAANAAAANAAAANAAAANAAAANAAAANAAAANAAAANAAAAAAGNPTAPTNPATGVDRLRELAELHDRGALTDEEFTAAKRQLLGL